MFFYIILSIAILSIVLALASLKEVTNKREIEQASKHLSKGRVVFQDSSEDSSSEESSSS